MSVFKYKEIVSKANAVNSNVKKLQKLGVTSKWSYYFAKSILSPRTDIKKISFKNNTTSNNSYLSRDIVKEDYLDLCRRLVHYVEANKVLPPYVQVGQFKIGIEDYAYALARIVVWEYKKKALPSKVNISSKTFVTKTESDEIVYNYFKKVFGDFGDTVDGALKKIEAKGYGHYFDDKYTNKEVIDGLAHKTNVRPNCTDVCHVLVNITNYLIRKGKYKKIDVLHVKCSNGEGHVRLAITLNNGEVIYRDGACTISDNGKGYKCNWCTSNYKLIAKNPKWFMENLNR